MSEARRIAYAVKASRVTLSVGIEKPRNTRNRLGQLIDIGQENHSNMIRFGPIETGALHQEDLLLTQ